MKNIRSYSRLFIAASTAITLVTAIFLLLPSNISHATGSGSATVGSRPVPNVDVNLTAAVTRTATGVQQAAAQNFKAAYGNRTAVRWNNFSGSPDVVMNFHTPPSTDTPENVARGFIQANSAMLAVEPASLILDYQREAMGGYILR